MPTVYGVRHAGQGICSSRWNRGVDQDRPMPSVVRKCSHTLVVFLAPHFSFLAPCHPHSHLIWFSPFSSSPIPPVSPNLATLT